MSEREEDRAHRCLVAVEDCGCLRAVVVLGYGHDAEAYMDAGKWAKAGSRIDHVTVAEFKDKDRYPIHCPEHPDGKWDARGRVKPAKQRELWDVAR